MTTTLPAKPFTVQRVSRADAARMRALRIEMLADSPLAFRFAGGLVLVIPALLFIAIMRKYLLNMWGTTIR